MKNLLQLGSSLARSTSAPAGYNQIDDTSEGRLKVHAEEAFRAGIKFKARFIGSLEIPKVRLLILSVLHHFSLIRALKSSLLCAKYATNSKLDLRKRRKWTSWCPQTACGSRYGSRKTRKPAHPFFKSSCTIRSTGFSMFLMTPQISIFGHTLQEMQSK